MADIMQQFQSFLSGQEKETEDVGRFTPDQIEAFNRGLFSEPEPQETQVEVSIPPEQREEYNQILQKPQDTYAQSLGAAYTLDDLENDQEFQFRADRFMSEIEKNEQIFEYLRDADFSLSSAMVRAFEVEGWTDQAKLDYNYLKETFDKASVGGLKQSLTLAKDMAIDLIADPLNLLAVFTGPAAFGASAATKAAVKRSANQSLKKMMKEKIYLKKDGGLSKRGGIETTIGKQVKKDVKRTALFGSIEGGAWAGAHDYFLQQGDVELGLRDEIDMASPLISATLGAGLGGIFGGSVGLYSATSPLLKRKMDWFSNEQNIITRFKSRGKTDAERKANIIDEEDPTKKSYNEDGSLKLTKTRQKIIAKTFGKATTEFIEAAKSSETLAFVLQNFRYDSLSTLGEAVKGLKTESFGLSFARLRGSYQYQFEKAIQGLDRVGGLFWKNIDPKQNEQLVYLLNNSRAKVDVSGNAFDPAVREAARKIKPLLERVRKDLASYNSQRGKQSKPELIGLDGKTLKYDALLSGRAKIKDYFPYRIQHDLLEKNRLEFAENLKKYGYKDKDTGEIISYAAVRNELSPSDRQQFVDDFGNITEGWATDSEPIDLNVFGRDFEQDAIRELRSEGIIKRKVDAELTPSEALLVNERAMDIKANKIIDDMLDNKDNPFEAYTVNTPVAGKGVGGRSGFLKERVFDQIPKEEMLKFVDNDVENVLNEYLTNAALLQKREQFFGRSLDVFKTRYVEKIEAELRAAGAKREDIKNYVTDPLATMYERVSGINVPVFGSKYGKGIADGVKLSQQLAHLPLATISSLTEPMILLSRVDAKDAPAAAKDVGLALYKEGKKIIERSSKAIKRAGGGKHKGFKDLDDEAWAEAYQTGLALEQAVVDRLGGLYGDIRSNKMQRISRGFFKTTLLAQWTSAVQLAAFTTGKRLILQKTEKLATGKLSNKARLRIQDELDDLGINYKDAIKWYENKNHRGSDGLFDINKAQQDPFYMNNYLAGANRFSREIILNPDLTEANKPLWYSNPAGQILMQFASYPTAFNNTILRKFAYEISRDAEDKTVAASAKIAATALLMSGTATITNAIRSGGRSLEKDQGLVILDSVDRWGGLGPMQYGYRYWENLQRGSGPIGGVLKAVSGPAQQDALDSILYRKGIFEIAGSNVPFYSLLPFEARKAVRDAGKSVDKAIFRGVTPQKKVKPKKKEYVPLYFAKGGIVEDVPQVKTEPDERVDKMTGLPYHIQAGVLGQDEEERFGFAIGGLPQALRSTIGLAKNKRGTASRTRWQDEDNLRIVDERRLKRLQKEGESLAIVTMQTARELLEDGQITIKEARALLREAGYKKQSIYKFIRTYKDAGYAKGDKFVTYRSGFAEGGPTTPKNSEVYSFLTSKIRRAAPILIDEEPITKYDEEELKGYDKTVYYRKLKNNTRQQSLEDLRDSENIGIVLETKMPTTEKSLKGYAKIKRPLDLSGIDIPIEGFKFVEEIETNPELKNKIIEDSMVSDGIAEEFVDNLLFEHSLAKQVIKGNENLPMLDKILNIRASYDIRETFKDIGFDSIVFSDASPTDNQMEDLGMREGFFAGGVSKAARWLLKKIISGGQTGIDELGLIIGKDLGLETGGTMPKGFKRRNLDDKDYNDPKFAEEYGLGEDSSTGYKPRTIKNIQDSDATVIFSTKMPLVGGSKLTKKEADKIKKPVIVNPTPEKLREFIIENKVETLNVAGNRGSGLKGLPIERKRKLKSVLVEGLQEKTTKTTGKKTVILDNDQHKPTTSFNKEERIARSKIINNPDTLFVFLDNDSKGAITDLNNSSAKIGRGLVNSIGIRAKRSPRALWSDEKETSLTSPEKWKGEAKRRGIAGNIDKATDDMIQVYQKFHVGKYKKIIFSKEFDEPNLNTIFHSQRAKITGTTFKNKFKEFKEMVGEHQLYNVTSDRRVMGNIKTFKPLTQKQKDFITLRKQEPTGIKPVDTSKVGVSNLELDKPRYVKGKSNIKTQDDLNKSDPVNIQRELNLDNDYKAFQFKIKQLEKSNPDLAEETYNNFMFETFPNLFREGDNPYLNKVQSDAKVGKSFLEGDISNIDVIKGGRDK